MSVFLALGGRRNSLSVPDTVLGGHDGGRAPGGVPVTGDPGGVSGVFPFIELVVFPRVGVFHSKSFRVAVGGCGRG